MTKSSPATFRFLGQTLRPLQLRQIVSLGVVASVLMALGWLIKPIAATPMFVAQSFFLACFLQAGYKLDSFRAWAGYLGIALIMTVLTFWFFPDVFWAL